MRSPNRARFEQLARHLEWGGTISGQADLAKLWNCSQNAVGFALDVFKHQGLITYERRRLATLKVTEKGKRLAPPIAPAPRPAPAPLVSEALPSWLTEPDDLLLVRSAIRAVSSHNLAAVSIVTRVAATAGGLVFLRLLSDLEDPGAVPEASPKAPQPPQPTKHDGPYRVLDSDGEELGTFERLSQAEAFVSTNDEADTIEAADGHPMWRLASDDDDTDGSEPL